MKRRIVIIIILTLLLILSGCSDSDTVDNSVLKEDGQLTEQEKLDDFEYMYKILKENYPFFEVNKRLSGVDWLNDKDKYIKMVKASKNDEEFYNALNNILICLNNNHTNMMSMDNYRYLQKVYTKEQMEPWAEQLNNPKAIERYLYQEESSNISSNNLEQYRTYNNVTAEIFEEEKIAYLRIKGFGTENITEDLKIIKPFLDDIKNINALVIDIRGNGGGDSRYWTDHLVPMLISKPLKNTFYYVYSGGDFSEEFVKSKLGIGYDGLEEIENIYKEKLINSPSELEVIFEYYHKENRCIKPNESVGFMGKIYLLVDRGVYSSAEMFAEFAKSTGFATLIGERTGGDGIGTDPLLCALPNSGYIFRFSGEMGLTSDGTCNEEFKTEPDIKVYAGRDSTLKNDQAMQKVIELEKLTY